MANMFEGFLVKPQGLSNAISQGLGAFAERQQAQQQQQRQQHVEIQAANLLQQSLMTAQEDPSGSQAAFIQAMQLAPDFVNNVLGGLKTRSETQLAGQEKPQTGRFQFKETPTGFLKIDSATGEQEVVTLDDKQAEALRVQREKELESEIESFEKKFDQSKKLRDEYRAISKDFESVADAYGRIQASVDSPDAAGDIALIFNYMKMLDPGSVVREGEFATAQNAGGVDDSIRNMYNKLVDGERLQPSQREMFSARAKKLFDVASEKNEERKGGIIRVGKRYGIGESDIFGEIEPTIDWNDL